MSWGSTCLHRTVRSPEDSKECLIRQKIVFGSGIFRPLKQVERYWILCICFILTDSGFKDQPIFKHLPLEVSGDRTEETAFQHKENAENMKNADLFLKKIVTFQVNRFNICQDFC
ncbi:predicted protein [Methanosarcina acetivorans C2A]|uniref:Uncharacterized protein n=1 Tax=Methanosarcina acetivorans (strain ATCC 35395 / DSM 2834 / JCM 12185 / C2A) TaxID=188937 RepID=Q8TI45_METAC|nr:predicted protein [Methanosarcina acetivorans C2A]